MEITGLQFIVKIRNAQTKCAAKNQYVPELSCFISL